MSQVALPAKVENIRKLFRVLFIEILLISPLPLLSLSLGVRHLNGMRAIRGI
jgi:hypothetical protein